MQQVRSRKTKKSCDAATAYTNARGLGRLRSEREGEREGVTVATFWQFIFLNFFNTGETLEQQ